MSDENSVEASLAETGQGTTQDAKRVLFSPLGGHDPITVNGDGSMLHIVRWYKPDEVVLYLTDTMWEYQEKDQRYTKAIDLLCAHTQQARPEIQLVRSLVAKDEVYLFDRFLPEFKQELTRIRHEHPTWQILVNVSSGTPGMKSALVLLGDFMDDLLLLQVTTPNSRMNPRDSRESLDDYELETVWELDPDNNVNKGVCRVHEVRQPNFKTILAREYVAQLIDAYDYEAAWQVAKGVPALARAAGEIRRAGDQLTMSPESTKGKNEAQLLRAYLWSLEVRLEQGHWTDFVLSLTPAITATAERLLDRHGLPRESYLSDDNPYRFDLRKAEGVDRLERALPSAKEYGNWPYVKNWNLMNLVREYCPEEVDQFEKIRHFEEGYRNKLAHQVVPAGKASIEAAGGSTFEEVMRTLYDLNGMEGGEYRRINARIKSLM